MGMGSPCNYFMGAGEQAYTFEALPKSKKKNLALKKKLPFYFIVFKISFASWVN